MKATGRTVSTSLLLGALLLALLSVPAFAAPKPTEKISKTEFSKSMRRLWEDHITWTRLYIVSATGNLPDQDFTAQRLLRNQDDIGKAVASFYGEAAGDKLTSLLKDHILQAAALIEAAKSSDKSKIDAAAAAWYANGDQIATFLSAANPKAWPLAEMKSGMKMHLDLTLAEASDRLQGKYDSEIRDYDQIHQHILGLADMLSNGIQQQFPERFAKS